MAKLMLLKGDTSYYVRSARRNHFVNGNTTHLEGLVGLPIEVELNQYSEGLPKDAESQSDYACKVRRAGSKALVAIKVGDTIKVGDIVVYSAPRYEAEVVDISDALVLASKLNTAAAKQGMFERAAQVAPEMDSF